MNLVKLHFRTLFQYLGYKTTHDTGLCNTFPALHTNTYTRPIQAHEEGPFGFMMS